MYTLHNIAVTWTTKLNTYTKKEGIELQKMILGMEILLHNIPKLILMVAISAALGVLPHTLIMWMSFAFIRSYASGLHAGDSITCTILTLLMFVAVPYMLQDTYFNEVLFVLTFAVVALGLYKYAPADTESRPILGKAKRDRLKRQAVLSSVTILIIALAFFDEVYYGIITLGTVYALMAILPITYKILKRRMNNYEEYE